MAETELVSTEPKPGTDAGAPTRVGRREIAIPAAVAIVVVIGLVLGSGSGAQPPATGAAQLVPSDALAYVNVSLDRGRPAVTRALTMAERFPGFPLASAAVQSRLGAILAGGRPVDFSSQIAPWLGNEAALALLNTPTSTAGSLIILDVRDQARAAGFIHAQGATALPAYRGTKLYAYPSGSELAFVSHFLVLGQDASVRAAIDVAAGSTVSLASSPPYQRAASTEPAGRVLDAYASLAGVRRLLAPQAGLIGALGDLLYQPALQGVTISLTPATAGARVSIHAALDPSLTRLSATSTRPFEPTLQKVMPAGSILMLDVAGLDRLAPQVLGAGSAAGVVGGIGPLLTRLGSALRSEGVDVHAITSLFDPETAVAIIPHAHSPTLVIASRTANEAAARTELAQLEIPLAQLFKPSNAGPGQVPEFNDRSVAGITDHQLVVTSGLELDYAVFRGLVVISTSLDGVAAIAQATHTLANDPGFRSALGSRPTRVTSLVYLNPTGLFGLGQQTGLTSSARFRELLPDLQRIGSVGLTSMRSSDASSAELSIRIS